jgi:hypothetical protein
MIKNRREARRAAASETSSRTTEEAPAGRALHFGPQALFALIVIVVLAVALWQSRNFGFRAGLFPWVIGTPTLLLALGQLVRDLYGKKKKPASMPGEPTEAPIELEPAVVRRRTISIILWIIGFFVAIWLVGFSYAVPLTILLYLIFAGESWRITVAVTFFSWLFYWSLFEKMLNVPFTEGLLITLIKGGQ